MFWVPSWILVFIFTSSLSLWVSSPLKSGSPARLLSWFQISIFICYQQSSPRCQISMASMRPQLKSTSALQNSLPYCSLLFTSSSISMKMLKPGIFSLFQPHSPFPSFIHPPHLMQLCHHQVQTLTFFASGQWYTGFPVFISYPSKPFLSLSPMLSFWTLSCIQSAPCFKRLVAPHLILGEVHISQQRFFAIWLQPGLPIWAFLCYTPHAYT